MEQIDWFLAKLRPAMTKVVRGENKLATDWSCKDAADPETKAHVDSLGLSVVRSSEDPTLLLYKLGSIMDTPILCQRVDNIFQPGRHT